jgi:uncharacterized protein YcbK (DUF882 family)
MNDSLLPTTLTRRCLLRAAAIAGLVTAPTLQAAARSMEARTVSFVHTHTGETLSCCYYRGTYDAAALSNVNHFLRDFRSGDVHAIDPQLLDVLYDLMVLADRDQPYQVISAYRSPATNNMLHERSNGVAAHSLHMEGRAIDLRLSGFSTRKLRDLALGMQRGGVGYYAASDFVHVDTGRVRAW